MAKKFDTWMIYHRKLLEKGVENYGRFFKKQDLYQFDKSTSEIKNELIKNNLLENWELPFHLNSPMEFLFLNEQLSPDVPLDVKGALKTQINSLKRLRNFYDQLSDQQKDMLNAVSEDETDSASTFEEELKDLEEEINKIYRSGIRGWAQRGLGRFFNVGKVDKSRLAETNSKEHINELFGTLALGSLALSGLLGKRALEKRAQKIQKLQKIAQKAVAEYGFDSSLLLPIPLLPPPPGAGGAAPGAGGAAPGAGGAAPGAGGAAPGAGGAAPGAGGAAPGAGGAAPGAGGAAPGAGGAAPGGPPTPPPTSLNIMAGSKGKGLQSIIMNSIRQEIPSVDFKSVQPQIASVLKALVTDLQASKKFSALNEKASKKLQLKSTVAELNKLANPEIQRIVKFAIRDYLYSHGGFNVDFS